MEVARCNGISGAPFATASLMMAAIPGPGVASIVGIAFSSGRRTALASVAGMAVGKATALRFSPRRRRDPRLVRGRLLRP